MAICSPREPVYYYECSAGGFRLVYFIPPDDLRQLCAADGISEQALLDFPDGVDLGCTEADFRDFDQLYGWRPHTDPEEIRRAFLALFSSTRRWKRFRGSGLIPARDLEKHLGPVANELESHRAMQEELPDLLQTTAKARRQERVRELKVSRVLEKMSVEGMDPKRDLRRQTFSKVAMQTEGDPAEVVFSMLHEKRRR